MKEREIDYSSLKQFYIGDLYAFNSPDKCGVYFLYQDGEIVYIGKSFDVIQRIRWGHGKHKDFDRWSFVPCEYKNLSELEAELVVKYQPKYNQRLPKNNRFRSVDWFKQQRWTDRKLVFYTLSMIKPVACIKGSYIYDFYELEALYSKYKHLKIKRIKFNY